MKKQNYILICSLAGVLYCILILLFAGLSLGDHSTTRESEVYLEDKYERDFTFVEDVYKDYLSGDMFGVNATAEKYKDSDGNACVVIHDLESGEQKDNYQNVIYCESLSEYLLSDIGIKGYADTKYDFFTDKIIGVQRYAEMTSPKIYLFIPNYMYEEAIIKSIGEHYGEHITFEVYSLSQQDYDKVDINRYYIDEEYRDEIYEQYSDNCELYGYENGEIT